MASSAAEAFRAKQQGNVNSSFNAQISSTNSSYDSKINSTTNKYNSEIAPHEAAAKRYGQLADVAKIRSRGAARGSGFLNSNEGAALMARHAEALEQQDDLYCSVPYPNSREFDEAYINYVKRLPISKEEKEEFLSYTSMAAARQIYNDSLGPCAAKSTFTDVTPAECRNITNENANKLIEQETQRERENREYERAEREKAASLAKRRDAEIARLDTERNNEIARLNTHRAEAFRMLNDEKYFKQYEELVLNGSKYAIQMYSESNKNPEIFDLRNICNKNFRGFEDNIPQINREINSNEFFLKGTKKQMPVSKTYIMNRDYLITDTLALKSYDDFKNSAINEVISGWHEILKNKIEIQPLILNEFQPYDVLTPGDLIPGVINAIFDAGKKIAGDVAGVGVSIGRHFLMKKQIESIAADPSQLYNTSHTKTGASIKLLENVRDKRYFTEDPVQVVQNMFNGGKWLNTFHIPYYGGDYLMSNFSGNWNTTGSEAFYGTSLAGRGGSAGEISLKRIWNRFSRKSKIYCINESRKKQYCF
jgi:hypothetical protein